VRDDARFFFLESMVVDHSEPKNSSKIDFLQSYLPRKVWVRDLSIEWYFGCNVPGVNGMQARAVQLCARLVLIF